MGMASQAQAKAQNAPSRTKGGGTRTMEAYEYEKVMAERILLQNAAVGREQAMAKLAAKYFRLLEEADTKDNDKIQDARKQMVEEIRSFRSQVKQLGMVLDASQHERQLLVEREAHLRKESQTTREEITNLVQEISVVQTQQKELDEYEGLYKACANLPEVSASVKEIQHLQRDTVRLEEEEQYLQASLDFFKRQFAAMLENIALVEGQIGEQMSQG